MEKINLVEILKNCPEHMGLDCAMYENVTLGYVFDSDFYPIKIRTPDGLVSLDKYGCCSSNKHAKCIIFPKGKTTWEGFVPPCQFKDGDIVATNTGTWIGITEGGKKGCFIPTYCVIKSNDKFEAYFDRKESWAFGRHATEEEKEKLFKAIKDNGYQWNAETKTLEKLVEPKFKVGDRVKDKNNFIYTVLSIEGRRYILDDIPRTRVAFVAQDNYELVPNKFDINTLKPFDKVLVRDNNAHKWTIDFFGFINEYKRLSFVCVGDCVTQCIPYEGNEHLLGKTDDCNEYFKIW